MPAAKKISALVIAGDTAAGRRIVAALGHGPGALRIAGSQPDVLVVDLRTAGPAASPPEESGQDTPLGYLERISVRSPGRVRFLNVRDIQWIEGADQYARLHLRGSSHLVRDSLAHLEARLDPGRFARTHRSVIVNLTRVHEILVSAAGTHRIALDDGTLVRLSREKLAEIEGRIALAGG